MGLRMVAVAVPVAVTEAGIAAVPAAVTVPATVGVTA
jgi:hypothetical protein